MAGGDNSVLTRVVRFFERQGPARCAARTRWRPTCWPAAGRSAASRSSDAGSRRRRARLCRARARSAPLDAGQAVVVARRQGAGDRRRGGHRRHAAAGGGACPAAASRRARAACWPRARSPARSCASTCRRSGRAPSSRRWRPAWPASWSRPAPCWSSIAAEAVRARRRARLRRPWPRRPRHATARSRRRRAPASGRVIGRLRPEPARCRRHRDGASPPSSGLRPSPPARRPWWCAPTSWPSRRPRAPTAMLERAAALAAVGPALAQVGVLVRRVGGRRRGWMRPLRPLLAAGGSAGAGRRCRDRARPLRSRAYEAAARLADDHGLFLVIVRGLVRE